MQTAGLVMCWKSFLPACDVRKLCLDAFLNNEVINLNAFKLSVFFSVLSFLPALRSSRLCKQLVQKP